MGKPIIAVITGTASGFTERELLQGIISENVKNGYSTAVFSAVYNIVQKNMYLECERRIYELVYSKNVSGVILFCESFVEERARHAIALMLKKLNIPLIGIGTELKEFSGLPIQCFDTDQVTECEELTDHLIDDHGITDIVMLTGKRNIKVSDLRAQGFRRSLEKHGIPFDEDNILYGDFWLNSGEALADSFISGERRLPRAVLCANDHMAYGLLRRLAEAGIKVPEQTVVIACEYSPYRVYYSPLLTCMRRGREALGAAAAEQLHYKIIGAPAPEFIPPKGSMVYGLSCPCSMDRSYFCKEQSYALQRITDYELNLFSTMDQSMTLCRDMKELIDLIGEYQWIIRDKLSMYLRLYSDWYDSGAVSEKTMESRCLMPWQDNLPFEHDRMDLQCLFDRYPRAVVCYYMPVFFGNNLFGDIAVLYDRPCGYEDVFRYWVKSVSIGLEYMRLKNDFRYLLSCQSIPEYSDPLTGLYNAKGLRRAFTVRVVNGESEQCCVMMRLFLFTHPFNLKDASRKEIMLAAASAIRRFCGESVMAGHIAEDTFVCFVSSNASARRLSDLLAAIMLCEKRFTDYADIDTFACSAAACGTETYDAILARCRKQIGTELKRLKCYRSHPKFRELIAFRNQIYASPEITFERDSEILPEAQLELYRDRYKKCFGVTFHQDCIQARVTRAKYYLATTRLDIAEISEKCGYVDYKYFQRQFAAITGLPALKYRALLSR